ncbi:uncharacterized protein TNIN_487551 [Trichonephila inaurata madagascariensis]|uniref:Uncharacterized protein n=1 Tax=Trichonephila inaurata madagascariensis TaxID=2747483 RepID=A0A8X7CE90_9ARAC|nr:uncharacterized protein TNIN_487551 [Trichonephila inaurata madagascariensis]
MINAPVLRKLCLQIVFNLLGSTKTGLLLFDKRLPPLMGFLSIEGINVSVSDKISITNTLQSLKEAKQYGFNRTMPYVQFYSELVRGARLSSASFASQIHQIRSQCRIFSVVYSMNTYLAPSATLRHTTIVDPPKDAKHPGRKGGYFYVYFFGSYQFAFVGSKHIFEYTKHHRACFDRSNLNPQYIIGVKASERVARYLRDERDQVDRPFFNSYADADAHVYFSNVDIDWNSAFIEVPVPSRAVTNEDSVEVEKQASEKKPKKGNGKKGTMCKGKKNRAVFATVNVKNVKGIKELVPNEVYVYLKRCNPLDFESKELYVNLVRCNEDKELKDVYYSALRRERS